MRQLVLDAVCYQEFRTVAKELIKSYYCASTIDYARATRNYLATSFIIVDEPDELLTHPFALLEEIERDGSALGDCDDVATLGAALLCAIGIPVRFKAILRAPAGHFTHVFLEFQVQNGDWLLIDTTVDVLPVYEPDDCMIVQI